MMLLLLLVPHFAQEAGGEWTLTCQINGVDDFSSFSDSLASLADIDGDGIRDFIVGDRGSDRAYFAGGAVYVHSGNTGALLFSFLGETDSAAFGNAVADAGDVDADGYHDILIGAPSTNLSGWFEGAAYVYSGRDGRLLHRFLGNSTGPGALGITVSGIGDLNSDGYDDILVGDPDVDPVPGSTGVIWAFSGRDGAVLMPIVIPGQGTGSRVQGVSDLNWDGIPDLLSTSNGVIVQSGADGTEIRRHPAPLPNGNFGSGVASLGDLDFDGVDDYIIGDSAAFTVRTGWAYVYSGATGILLREYQGREMEGEFGSAVAGPGDVDGDGFPDVLIGAPHEDHGSIYFAGAAYLFSGFDGTLLAKLAFNDPGAKFYGWSMASAGDVNDDGLTDFAIGSLSSAGGGVENGVVRIYALHSYLNLSSRSISAGAGATIQFDLDFPDTDAGKDYFLLASGGVPGRTRVLGHWLPLARTPLLDLMAHNPPGFISGAQGTLDGFGNATSTATLAPNQAAAWIGRTIKFVAVSFDAQNDISLYSAAMTLTIEP